MPKGLKRKIVIGEKKHGLTCLGEAPKKNGKRMVRVLCDCKKEATIQLDNFGRNKTCGNCFEDNISEHPLYHILEGIKARCYNENHQAFHNYGGRGIKLQPSWESNSREFLKYISKLPNAGEPGYSLDRIDNNRGYEDGNLRFATSSEQQLNQRIRKDNTSGVKGVYFDKGQNKWISNYKSKYIGCFEFLEDAIEARIKAEQRDPI